MKTIRTSIAALMVGASAMLMSSCIGSFGLTGKLYAWNKTITNDKWINEVIFAGLFFWAYPLLTIFDAFIFNSIEFWTGSNPIAGVDMNVQGEKGEYHVRSTGSGYHIEHLGTGITAELVFDAANQTWSFETAGQSVKLLSFADGNANAYFNGSVMNVDMAKTLNLMAAR